MGLQSSNSCVMVLDDDTSLRFRSAHFRPSAFPWRSPRRGPRTSALRSVPSMLSLPGRVASPRSAGGSQTWWGSRVRTTVRFLLKSGNCRLQHPVADSASAMPRTAVAEPKRAFAGRVLRRLGASCAGFLHKKPHKPKLAEYGSDKAFHQDCAQQLSGFFRDGFRETAPTPSESTLTAPR